MAIVISSNHFLSSFDQMYWEITDNLSTDDVKKLRQKVPGQFVGAYVLRDSHVEWKNYINTEVTYLSWEHASEYHAGAELRPLHNTHTWYIQHPVGDIYVVYV